MVSANSTAGGGSRSAFDTVQVDDGAFRYNDKYPVEMGMKGSRHFWLRPVGGVSASNNSGPHIFSIEPMVDQYINLNAARLEIVARVMKSDGTSMTIHEDIVAPVNLLGAAMWKNVEVRLNGKPFSGASFVHAGYKAFMETMLTYDADSRNTHLATQFFHLDSPGQFGNMRLPASTVRGTVKASIKEGALPGPTYPPELQALPRLTGAHNPCKKGERHGREDDTEDEGDTDHEPEDPELDEDDDDDDGGGGGGDAAAGGGDVTMRTASSRNASVAGSVRGASGGRGGGGGDGGRGTGAKRKRRLDRRYHCLSPLARRQEREKIFERYVRDRLPLEVRYLKAGTGMAYNKGYDARFKVVCGSHPFDMYAPIPHDFFKLDNHIGPGNRIEIRLTPYSHAFLLNTYLDWQEYTLLVDDLKLHLHTIERRERIRPPLTEKYLMNETQLHRFIVPERLPTITLRIHNGGVLPKQVVVGMVDTKAMEGSYDYNPFNFHHFDASKIVLTINGETHPSNGLSTDFGKPNAHVARAYHWVYENTGAAGTDKGNIISWAAFQAGCFLVPFDLTFDKCNGLHNHNAQYGYMDLTIDFAEVLPCPIYVLCEMIFPKVVVNCKVTNTMAILDVEA